MAMVYVTMENANAHARIVRGLEYVNIRNYGVPAETVVDRKYVSMIK